MLDRPELKNLKEALDELANDFTQAEIEEFSKLLEKELKNKESTINIVKVFRLTELNAVFVSLAKKFEKKDPKILSDWMRNVLRRIDPQELEVRIGFSTNFLEIALNQHLKSLAIYLIEINNIALYSDFNSYSAEKGYKPLFFVIEGDKFDKDIFDRLLAQEKDINHVSAFGQTALYLAIESGNQYALNKLLEHKDLKITGRFFNITVFDLAKHDPSLYKKLCDKLNENFNAKDYDWNELIEFPIAELNKENQQILYDKLIAKINELDVFLDRDLKAAFLQFLNDPTPLPFKHLNRLAIAFECVSYLVNPSWVNQHNNNLCGPAVLMQQLVQYQPQAFVYSVMELSTLGSKNRKANKYLPAHVTSMSKETLETSFSLTGVWGETIRHNYNMFIGYSGKSKWEFFYGLTTPYSLARMFSDFNCKVLDENTEVRLDTESRFGSLFEGTRKKVANYGNLMLPSLKVYSSKHKEMQDDTKRLETLLEWSANHPGQLIVALINKHLLNDLLGFGAETDKEFMLVEDTHYINIMNLKLSDDGKKIIFDFFTYGRGHISKEIDLDVFKKGFRGGLLVMPPEYKEEPKKQPTLKV